MPVHLMNNETSKKEKKFPVHDVLFCCCYPTNSYDFCLPQDGRIFHLFKECVCVGEITSFLMCGRWEAINAFRSPNVLTIGLICVQITSIFLLILCVTTAYCLTDYFNSWNIQCSSKRAYRKNYNIICFHCAIIYNDRTKHLHTNLRGREFPF